MGNRLDNYYKDVYDIIDIVTKMPDGSSPEELDAVFGPVLKGIGVAAWRRAFWAVKSVAARAGIDNSQVNRLTTEEYDETKKISFRIEMSEVGHFDCDFFPGSDFEEGEEIRQQLDMLSRSIWYVYGRAFLVNSYHFLNNHDPMTRAYNRSYLEMLMARLCEEGRIQDYVGAVINIKNFKSINERYSEQVGNVYLIRYCDIVMSQLMPDECFTRLGGDNFVLLVRKERVDFFHQFLLNIEFVLPTHEGDTRFHVRMRAGIYEMKPNERFGSLMSCANEALHVAYMPEQRDFVWFEELMQIRRTTVRVALESFPKALKNHEFVPYYQPKVLLETSSLYGAEALCRWIKDGKIVPPSEFIPALENDGAITKLDFYMLDRVCADIAKWTAMGLDPGRISVNFSKNHLHDEEFGRKIVSIIDSHEVNHHNIEIELTETSGFDNNSAMMRFVSYMKSEDIHTSIDDFGTGSSSLNMLSGLGMDIVKLDKSFVDDIEYKPSTDQLFVKNIINMINELDIETVAEGVEGEGQANLLREWNCRVVQGYLYDMPLSAEEFSKRIEDINYYTNKFGGIK